MNAAFAALVLLFFYAVVTVFFYGVVVIIGVRRRRLSYALSWPRFFFDYADYHIDMLIDSLDPDEVDSDHIAEFKRRWLAVSRGMGRRRRP